MRSPANDDTEKGTGMTKPARRTLLRRCCALLVAASVASSVATAQTYPDRPIKLVIPYPAGAGIDIVARMIAPRVSEGMGQQIVVENRAGAGAIIGVDAVAKAAPDGYTLGMADAGPLAINPAIYAQLPYDPARDLAPVILVSTLPTILIAHPSLNVTTVGELIALAKQKPGTINFASGGTGTANHLAMELFKSQAGIDIVHVPYKGTAPALAGVLTGNPSIMFSNLLSAGSLIKAGKVRALAIASKQRTSAMPDLPTIAEAGVPGYEFQGWFGIVAPAATPAPIIDRLNREFRRVLESAEIRQRLLSEGGMEAGGGGPDAFGKLWHNEIVVWGKVVKERGIKTE
jgi:tripartite-type tricarboxylate transporter receptor subunit TctC